MVYICDGCGKTSMKIYLHDEQNLCRECYEKAMMHGKPTHDELVEKFKELEHKLEIANASIDYLAKKHEENLNTINQIKNEIRKVVTERRK